MADDPTPDPTGANPPDPKPDPDPPKPDDDPKLGPAGESALKAEREARAAAEKKAKAAEAELDKIRKANMNEQEKAVATARDEARAEANKEANARILKSEVRAAASGKLADPADAPALLGDLDRFLADDGEIDSKAISAAIADLVKTKPYLAPAGRPGKLPGGGAKPSEGVSMDDWLRQQALAKGRG